jgi:signal transduction histidine kinase
VARRTLARAAARLPDWRSALVTGALLGTMLISAFAAWAVHDAWTEHRAAVDESLGEYARYAARAFGEQLLHAGDELRLRALAPVMGNPVPAGEGAMPLARFASLSGAVVDAAGLAGDTLGGAFRMDPRGGAYEGAGAAAAPALAAQVRGAIYERLVRGDWSGEPLVAMATTDGAPVLVAFARQRTTTGGTAAIFGRTMSYDLAMRVLASAIQRRLSLVPPSFVAAEWRVGRVAAGEDTVVAIQLLDRAGRELYRSPVAFASLVRGEFTVRAEPVGFVVRATMHPHLVDRIAAAHRHDERRRIQVALPLLSILLAAAAIANLLRERELVRARRDFVASVSHELRTPLAQIRMFSEMLVLRRERDDDERRRWLGVIGREARRLGDLVESILLFSHIDAARTRLEPERTDLGELVEEIVEGYLPMAESRRMRILADAPSRIYADVDPRATRQIVVNLLDNALKYGPEGQRVLLELERAGAVARLAVSDQGPGVKPEDRERLWRPFVRLHHAGASSAGSGIGLAVVRGLVEQQGGAVRVEDAEGGGARFVVELPLAADVAAPAPAPGAPKAAPA